MTLTNEAFDPFHGLTDLRQEAAILIKSIVPMHVHTVRSGHQADADDVKRIMGRAEAVYQAARDFLVASAKYINQNVPASSDKIDIEFFAEQLDDAMGRMITEGDAIQRDLLDEFDDERQYS